MKGLIILIPLVIALNGLWFWVKSILSDNGYKTSYWFHFSDIPNIFDLALKTEDKKIKNKYLTIGTTLIIGIILFPIIAFNSIPSIGDNRCSFQQHFNNGEWGGVVTTKYLDSKNHQYETLELLKDGQTFKVQNLVTDWNSTYDSIQIADSLVKKPGANFVTIYRDGLEKQLVVDCGCRE